MGIGRLLGATLGFEALLVVAPAFGQEYTRAPIGGGAVLDLAFDRSSEGVVYAAVRGPGLFKSVDDGRTFSERALPGMVVHQPRVVLPSVSEPGVVLLCEPNARASEVSPAHIYRSSDGGETFDAVASFPDDSGCSALVEGLAPGTFLAASGETPELTLHVSTDSGQTWSASAMSAEGRSGDWVTSMVELPSGRLVLGLSSLSEPDASPGFGSLAYTDNLAEVVFVDSGSRPAYDLAWNGGDSLFAFGDYSDPGLWSTADGANFEGLPFSDGGSGYYPWTELRYVPERDVFLILSSNRLLQSTTGQDGYEFNSREPLTGYLTGTGSSSLRTMAADPFKNDVWLAGTDDGGIGVMRREGEPDTWTQADGIDAARVELLAYDPISGFQYAADSGRLFFADTGALSFRCLFHAEDWIDEIITAFAFDRQDPKRVLVSLRVDDDGRVPQLLELPDATTAMVDDYRAEHSAWEIVPTPRPPADREEILALIVSGSRRYVAYGASEEMTPLYRSEDDGRSYAPLPLVLESRIEVLAQHPQQEELLFVGTDAFIADVGDPAFGLFRSDDGGDSWETLVDALFEGEDISAMAFDPENPDRFWVASEGIEAKVFQTVDRGATFVELPPPVGRWQALALTFSPDAESLVLARYEGLYSYSLEDNTLAQLTELQGEPVALYPGGLGVATNAGLYVRSEILGTPYVPTASSDEGAQGLTESSDTDSEETGGSSTLDESTSDSTTVTDPTDEGATTQADTTEEADDNGSVADAMQDPAAADGAAANGADAGTLSLAGDTLGAESGSSDTGGCACRASSKGHFKGWGASLLALTLLFRRRRAPREPGNAHVSS